MPKDKINIEFYIRKRDVSKLTPKEIIDFVKIVQKVAPGTRLVRVTKKEKEDEEFQGDRR